ncbi:hypothetical protein HaLaN_21093 [Haematococcus lacustris]|uniref:Uncharacterized protein n=1 Tax=Haematococcus lacustris TaxID=44745 RepID=A0A699ZL25_HAELA|nr:hypothetical protein HaLaN_21093 [Haematococcus lacustris]
MLLVSATIPTPSHQLDPSGGWPHTGIPPLFHSPASSAWPSPHPPPASAPHSLVCTWPAEQKVVTCTLHFMCPWPPTWQRSSQGWPQGRVALQGSQQPPSGER